MRHESIAIAGPGRMGVGIATAVLMADRSFRVCLADVKPRTEGGAARALERARGEIEANLRILQDLGVLGRDWKELAGSLDLASGLDEAVSGSTLVFEALPEIVEVKQDFFRRIGAFLAPQAVIASTTSTFHLETFWEVCQRPENVVCAHWLNPAFLIPLVEVAHGAKTDARAVDGICDFLRLIGKIPVAMRTSPGFIVPRIQAAAMNEAVRILAEGVASAAEIDTAIKAGFGFRLGVMGLIEFVDLGGVDILFHAGNYLYSRLGGEHFKPPPLVADKMARGEVGPKTGKGFYDYAETDVRALFAERYRGFVELLRTYARSEHLNFTGGVAPERPQAGGGAEPNRKEST
jgi:3-hydroxybutyryl-CoA dehydrogenase